MVWPEDTDKLYKYKYIYIYTYIYICSFVQIMYMHLYLSTALVLGHGPSGKQNRLQVGLRHDGLAPSTNCLMKLSEGTTVVFAWRFGKGV